MSKKIVAIIGGGTVSHIRPHLALAAPAYGKTARQIFSLFKEQFFSDAEYTPQIYLTKMAGGQQLETNEDVAALVDTLISSPNVRMIFMPVAMCDFEAYYIKRGRDVAKGIGKDFSRLKTLESHSGVEIGLMPAAKVIDRIRKERKDIFLVGFKTTTGAAEDEQFDAGLRLLKGASCNLVLANDTRERRNMIITPEQARYSVTEDRTKAMVELVDMAVQRAKGQFTRTTVETDSERIPWDSKEIPETFRRVVDFCVEKGAYKPFNGITVGHFAFRPKSPEWNYSLVSSCRKQDFNTKEGRALVRVDFKVDEVIAHGVKPSAGARSQWEVLAQYPGWNCIIHFHCPVKGEPSHLSVRPQRNFECGSHDCGQNTANGMKVGTFYGGKLTIGAVMLDKHGPNILFKTTQDPELVCRWIDEHFDLAGSTSSS